MAVIYAGGRGGGLLGTLGALAGGLGMMTGTPWLSMLGTGMNAANAAMRGDPSGLAGAMAGIANGDLNGMQGMTAGNIARTDEANAAANVAQAMDLEEYLPPVGQTGTGYAETLPPVDYSLSPLAQKAIETLKRKRWNLEEYPYLEYLEEYPYLEYPEEYPYLKKIPQDTWKQRRIRGY